MLSRPLLAALLAGAFTAPEFPGNWSLLTWALLTNLPVSFFGHTGGIIPEPDEVLAAIERAAAGETFNIVPFHSTLKGGDE